MPRAPLPVPGLDRPPGPRAARARRINLFRRRPRDRVELADAGRVAPDWAGAPDWRHDGRRPEAGPALDRSRPIPAGAGRVRFIAPLRPVAPAAFPAHALD